MAGIIFKWIFFLFDFDGLNNTIIENVNYKIEYINLKVRIRLEY